MRIYIIYYIYYKQIESIHYIHMPTNTILHTLKITSYCIYQFVAYQSLECKLIPTVFLIPHPLSVLTCLWWLGAGSGKETPQ